MRSTEHIVRRTAFMILLIALLVGCDQTTKSIARSSLSDGSPVILLDGAIRLEYTENHGAFLSIGAGLPDQWRFLIFVVFVSLALLIAFVLTLRVEFSQRLQVLGLTMIIAGGFGNLIDRILNDGAVIDFVSVGFGSVRTGVFNLADLIVSAGFVVLLAHTLKQITSSHRG